MSHQSTIHPDLLDVFQEAFDATSLDFTTVDDVEVQNGRNASAIARFDRAGRVHLKRMEGPEREQRYARTVAFEHWRCGRELHFHAPTLLAHDENHTCVAFGFVDSETNVGHAVANGTADVTLLEQCMAAIGSLHCQPVDPTMDTSLPEYPLQHVGAVGLAYLENATFGELSLWQILQHDRELAAGRLTPGLGHADSSTPPETPRKVFSGRRSRARTLFRGPEGDQQEPPRQT